MQKTYQLCVLIAAGANLGFAPLAAADDDAGKAGPLPLSDQGNKGGWVLNTDISDEFDGDEIDHDKWFVQGKGGNYYIWKGRAPSQYAPHNVIVSDGTLKLRTQWEPDFKFADHGYAGAQYGEAIAPVTTAAIISKKRFLNGYMEARTKANPATMTSAFWAIGYESELDVYEQMGNIKLPTKRVHPEKFNSAGHDWRPGHFEPEFGRNKSFQRNTPLGYNVSSGFHVYAAEWSPNSVKFYVDGVQTSEIKREDAKGWVLNNPLEIWFDSEIFRWLGYPDKGELPADYEIDYVRIWQKPTDNLLAPAFFGFEGPMLYEDKPRPLDLVPESSEENDYQKFWRTNFRAQEHWSVVEDSEYHSGIKALAFRHDGQLPTARSFISGPEGSVDLKAGAYTLTMMVKPEEGVDVKELNVWLDDPHFELPAIDLSALIAGQWNTVSIGFDLPTASGDNDLMKLSVHRDNVGKDGSGSIFIDDIAIKHRN